MCHYQSIVLLENLFIFQFADLGSKGSVNDSGKGQTYNFYAYIDRFTVSFSFTILL